MTKFGGTVLEFNGNKYNLHNLIQMAASAPKIDIEGVVFNNDISKKPEEIKDQFKVTYHNGVPEDVKELIIFKQEGGYTILVGFGLLAFEELHKAKLSKARLISTPALKKARFEKDAPVGDPPTTERVLNSSASGAMADKMQQAFVSAPRAAVKQERFERQPVTPPPDVQTRKVQNSNLSGAHYDPSKAGPTGHSSLTQQTRAAGYSEMTSHQRKPSLSELTRPPGPSHQAEAGLNHPTGVRPRAHQFGTGKRKP